ncbi:5-deoxy-glucuronate isomerase [Nocardioides taihuensis]|uniref:5-deoxy-glucuronate isomerase n=1 Tax=Nocardioides taihuensis TaxID=1835606 RepID=A0ABW0BFZ3_9ACTN
MNLHLSAEGRDPEHPVDIGPDGAGWDYSGLRVLVLEPGTPTSFETGASEVFVLPLRGSLDVEVRADASPEVVEAQWALEGRDSVFTRVTDFAYVGRGSTVRLLSEDGAEVAVPSARCEQRLAPRYGPAAQVPVEVRGAGPATRQVTNFGVPGVWDHAERLICCELVTPPGNWSSYPPHKHDASEPCPVVNEEIYYFRIAGADQVTPDRSGFGYHRTYTGPEHDAAGLAPVDLLAEVRDHDVVLIPHGYHGPCIAAPGYPMYYLNVMAGPGGRAMVFCDDPAHTWVRDSWSGTAPDPRCPVTSADGRVTAP